MADQLAPSERHQFIHGGRLIYEWDQSFSEVNIYIQLPDSVKAKDLYCDITTTHLRLGMGPNPPYLDEDFNGAVKGSECYWTVEDGVLHITLQKSQAGEPWQSALKGHSLSAEKVHADKKRILLERFQEEHPGFDFSGAEVTGSEIPNPRTFMKNMDNDEDSD